MFGLILWSFVLLASVLESSALETDVERCFLYPVGEGKSSSVNIEGKASLSVTINHIFENPNIVKILDQNNKCVAALQYKTSVSVDCKSVFQTDDEFTTLFFRNQDGKLSVKKTHSFGDELILMGGVKELQVNSSELVNIAFDCQATDCYKFEKTTIHKRYGDQKPFFPTFKLYGKIKSSANNWNTTVNVNDSTPVSFDTSTFTKDKWNYVTFDVSFEANNSKTANVLISYLKRQYFSKKLTLPNRSLYLNFNNPKDVMWAINCIPGEVIHTSNSANEHLWTVFMTIGGLTLFLIIVVIGVLLINRNHSPYDGCTCAIDKRVFLATVGEGTREKLMGRGEVRLLVENGYITIISLEGHNIARFDVSHIRRFGFDNTNTNFYFEAGRKSAHGEGRFDFITIGGNRIAEVLRQETEYLLARMVTRTTSDPLQSPVLIPNTHGGYEIPLTFDDHEYEEIPGVPTEYLEIPGVPTEYEEIPGVPTEYEEIPGNPRQNTVSRHSYISLFNATI
ncbi:uncharacterized protein [Palaemon carinicauda]|uniref:uncharacterized protein n=1 Tax=Palaemon carinicauda TaxID=392227 RepID=UPI0035B689FF